jgi:nicotinate-nucleotide--dimethylbenzimidazole phosphoribosyltransferase
MNIDWLESPAAEIDAAAMDAARARQSQLTKPPGSLGALEDLAIRLAGMQKTRTPRATMASRPKACRHSRRR